MPIKFTSELDAKLQESLAPILGKAKMNEDVRGYLKRTLSDDEFEEKLVPEIVEMVVGMFKEEHGNHVGEEQLAQLPGIITEVLIGIDAGDETTPAGEDTTDSNLSSGAGAGDEGRASAEPAEPKFVVVRLPRKISSYGGAFYDHESGTWIKGAQPVKVKHTNFVKAKIKGGELIPVE